jgi:lysophospholipase L1-like esterase
VLSDGNSGETSWEGAARIVSTLARNPEAQAYVMFYGANDSGGSMPTPPFEVSLDETPDTVNPVTFKDYLQKMINEVENAGKQLYLVKAPPYFANLTRDGLVQQYNQVVDRLIFENGLGYVAADLHDYFTLNPGEYAADGIHPDGDGYASIAREICEQLNGEMGLICIP